MKNRVVRVTDETWDAAKATAEKEGTTVSAVVRRLLAAYAKAGAVLVLVLVALAGCGSADPATSAAPERSAVVSAPVAETTVEPVETRSAAPVPTCWTDPSGDSYAPQWLDTYNAMGTQPEVALAFLETLPPSSEGCEQIDRDSLAQAEQIAENIRTALAAGSGG